MTGIVHDAMAQHTDDYRVGECLHAVPPHLVYGVEFEGRRAVCKVATGPPADPVAEARVTSHVDAHTSVPVPRILAAGRDPDHFLAAWCDDAPTEAETRFDPTVARAMGRTMATLHAETAPDAYGSPLGALPDAPAVLADDGSATPEGRRDGGLAVETLRRRCG